MKTGYNSHVAFTMHMFFTCQKNGLTFSENDLIRSCAYLGSSLVSTAVWGWGSSRDPLGCSRTLLAYSVPDLAWTWGFGFNTLVTWLQALSSSDSFLFGERRLFGAEPGCRDFSTAFWKNSDDRLTTGPAGLGRITGGWTGFLKTNQHRKSAQPIKMPNSHQNSVFKIEDLSICFEFNFIKTRS